MPLSYKQHLHINVLFTLLTVNSDAKTNLIVRNRLAHSRTSLFLSAFQISLFQNELICDCKLLKVFNLLVHILVGSLLPSRLVY